jgi:hypothetical protein
MIFIVIGTVSFLLMGGCFWLLGFTVIQASTAASSIGLKSIDFCLGLMLLSSIVFVGNSIFAVFHYLVH